MGLKGFFDVISSLFRTSGKGGLIKRVVTGIMDGFLGMGRFFGWFTGLFVGGWSLFTTLWGVFLSYHAVEFARRLLYIGLVSIIANWIVDYMLKNILIYDNKSIITLFSNFITSINSYGALGHNLLAFMTKIGFFEALSLFLIVMLYTLTVRIALSILFR